MGTPAGCNKMTNSQQRFGNTCPLIDLLISPVSHGIVSHPDSMAEIFKHGVSEIHGLDFVSGLKISVNTLWKSDANSRAHIARTSLKSLSKPTNWFTHFCIVTQSLCYGYGECAYMPKN